MPGAELLELLSEPQNGARWYCWSTTHWADSASLHALAFCLRRLRADRILALLAARAEEAHPAATRSSRAGPTSSQ